MTPGRGYALVDPHREGVGELPAWLRLASG